jgi:hypothetical protein
LRLPPWSPEDGPLQGLYCNKPPGHRYLLGCSWATSKGILKPDDLLPRDIASPAQILAEIEDRAHQAGRPYSAECARLLELAPNWPGWLAEGHRLLAFVRATTIEYTAAFDMPNMKQIHILAWRPGWRPPGEVRGVTGRGIGQGW